MEINEILEKVNGVFKDVLDNDNIKLTEETTANDVEEWDSLSHIQLIVALERAFKIRFNAAEIRNWKNISEMCEAIKSKVN